MLEQFFHDQGFDHFVKHKNTSPVKLFKMHLRCSCTDPAKYDTGATITMIRGRDYIFFGTWNVRTLKPDGKLDELSHEMERYRWHIIGLSEV